MDKYDKTVEEIKSLTKEEMARLRRYAPSGHPYFDSTKPYHKIFKKRFEDLGGFNSEISKNIDRR